MIWHTLPLAALTLTVAALQALPPVEFTPVQIDQISSAEKGFSLATVDRVIYVQDDFASWTDQDGLTLIPPSVEQFAQTFRDDLEELTDVSWSYQTVKKLPIAASGIFLGRSDTPEDFTYEDGTATEEGYELVVESGRVFIYGSGARGMWWGTRSLLQQIILHPHATLFPGRITDTPAYPTRGMMLDAGRKWYSLDYLKDLCTYASFFKLSEFHYHATDNYPLTRGPNVTWEDVYSQFSLRPENPELAPLVQRVNETLSRSEFVEFQQHCAQRGVTVILEIESPGHCLSVTKWKPELALESKDLLNLTHPETLPLVKSIWSEFLPWCLSKVVHIGADEYASAFADEYVNFVNEMSDFIYETHGKKIRIWGTYEPSALSINRNITIQHWQYGQSDPVALAENGYQIINSEDWWAYLSLKNNHVPITPAPYPQFFDNDRLLNFGDVKGWQWTPDLFNPVNTTDQPVKNAVRGAILAAWNDNGPDATTQLEAFYAVRNGIPVVASRAWSGSRGPLLDQSTLDDSISILTANAVSQSLDRKIGSQPRGLFSWSDAQHHQIGLGSKGMNYTLELEISGPFSLQSDDAVLSLSADGQLVFSADGWPYPLRSVAETDGFDPTALGRIWANSTTSSHDIVNVAYNAQITIKTNQFEGSRVWIDGQFVGRFEVFVYGGKNQAFSWSQMAFVAPLDCVLGTGLRKMDLYET
ncbi:hypothetical protein N7466_003630 [Penicillium verhagenii]|uniref:uncharacterized protein n=1 Tax=Penicillium verhagenii TaxID=1562060 RepID=UPI00254513C5|nr:uncharacterized protein N7466_003630 [Penicillium verhagenii]KAJ5934083.1 hypothetical protein N7466_003630 [Penicillium verhagenii]